MGRPSGNASKEILADDGLLLPRKVAVPWAWETLARRGRSERLAVIRVAGAVAALLVQTRVVMRTRKDGMVVVAESMVGEGFWG